MALFSCAPRALYTKILVLGSCLTLALLLYTVSLSSSPSFSFSSLRSSFSSSSSWPSWTSSQSKHAVSAASCTPLAYSSGKWMYSPRTNQTALVHPEDALSFAGFAGCASSREFYWHLASDNQGQWDRFPVVDSWKWDLSDTSCSIADDSSEYGFRDLEREKHKRQFVQDLVENGGWLVLGDSITEGHFFSISCLLYPHVVATPDYVKNPYFNRAWPQNLYLNPDSPLVSQLSFPEGFNTTETPLITFRRIDLLLSLEELVELHKQKHSKDDNFGSNFTLFSNEAVWTMSPSQYVSDILLSPLPKGNYANLIVSTAGHWTTTMFSGYANDTDKADVEHHGEGIDGLIDFFGEAMEFWANQVQDTIMNDQTGVVLASGGRARRQAMVRAYLPGHEDCHDHRKPWAEIEPMKWNWYNWGSIWKYNEIFETLLSKPDYPDIHYLSIDRPARLRPDAHATGDCLHIMAGAGVLEGWTEYIWHYATYFTRERRVYSDLMRRQKSRINRS
ncbi:hypothetical protein J3R30DRAFT_3427842 [Lentinula aciculospora]|uniref:Uncharacterized protein n=1 Tax=Lentinula aciculospora TaxID=153920 RepID=A0A9W9DXL9_9AGAR|nr:hypothetical protein J3R30DRAFT_3427842 [Lentinula aciculospora]